jgi:hypothetical protein
MERTGWSLTNHIFGLRFERRVCERPPRLHETRMLRDIFLIAQPPLLCKEGNIGSLLTLATHSHLEVYEHH